MSRFRRELELEISGTELADWWWELDSLEQADFFARLEEIKERDPAKFYMQLEYLREAMERLLRPEHQASELPS